MKKLAILSKGSRTLEILLLINENRNLVSLFKKTNASYKLILDAIKHLKQLGLIYTEKTGRSLYIDYTQKGLKIYTLLLEIREILNKNEVK